MTPPGLIAPDYGGACLSNLVSALGSEEPPVWVPSTVAGARQVVLLVLDGLGWEQLSERTHLSPCLASLDGGPITTVAPSTTASALSSITLGCPPATHGVVGYRVRVGDGEVLDVLRWRTSAGDARASFPPSEFQPHLAFGGRPVPVVSRAEFAGSGFSGAHIGGAHLVGWRVPSTLPVEIRSLLSRGEPLVYAYYDGIDKIAHAHGFGEHYDAELAAVDRLVADITSVLPSDAVLVVTSDHGQVDVGDRAVALDPDIAAAATMLSGEARFRWLHARPGKSEVLAAAAKARYGEEAWVGTRDEVEEQGWLGGPFRDEVVARLGDVALVASAPIGFLDPAEPASGLVCRHGSLTPAEMLVPLLATRRLR